MNAIDGWRNLSHIEDQATSTSRKRRRNNVVGNVKNGIFPQTGVFSPILNWCNYGYTILLSVLSLCTVSDNAVISTTTIPYSKRRKYGTKTTRIRRRKQYLYLLLDQPSRT